MKTIPVILQNLLDSLAVGIMVVDAEGKLLAINRVALDILGHVVDGLERSGLEALISADEKNNEFARIMEEIVLEKRVNIKRSTRYVGANNRIRQISVTGSFLTDGKGKEDIVILINDVTELHHAHEIEKTVLKEKSALQHERAESIRRMADAVAHQIRNPIMSIGGFSLRMLKGMDGIDPKRKYAEMILEESKRLEDVVSAVSNYTKLLQIAPEKTLISEVVSEAKTGLQVTSEKLSKKVEWAVSLEPIEARVDAGLLAYALKEIFLNAIEFCKEDYVRIQVRVYKKTDGLHIRVKDEGPGIARENRPFIFDPFFTTKAVGVGMGLCKARRVVREHKGKIAVNSRLGKGTEVTICLPKSRMVTDNA